MRLSRFGWSGGLVLGLLLTGPAKVQAQEKERPLPPLQLPDLEKLLPPGTIDAEQLKQLKQLLEGQNEEFRKMMEDLQKQFPGGQLFPQNMQMPAFGLTSGERDNRLGATLQKPSPILVE